MPVGSISPTLTDCVLHIKVMRCTTMRNAFFINYFWRVIAIHDVIARKVLKKDSRWIGKNGESKAVNKVLAIYKVLQVIHEGRKVKRKFLFIVRL
jgi:hypothetical protein